MSSGDGYFLVKVIIVVVTVWLIDARLKKNREKKRRPVVEVAAYPMYAVVR